MATATLTTNLSVGGIALSQSVAITDEALTQVEVTCPAAQAGTLGTRTSDTAGTATLAADHTITTGMKVDVVWAAGSARNATVGTVSGTSVPFTGLTGDALPTQATAIKVCPVVSVPLFFDPEKAVVEAFKANGGGQVAFRTDSAEVTSSSFSSAYLWCWTSEGGIANPLGTAVIESAQCSTSDLTAQSVSIVVLSSVQ
jgi:hypothetical protein